MKRTRLNRLVLRPDSSKSMECYVDASFANGWSTGDPTDRTSVLSRTGYVIKFADCPILWTSQLQTEITLSTTESEYVALSQSLRDVIPLMELMREIQPLVRTKFLSRVVHCTVFEDNEGALALARLPRMRPRTKHIALKFHHFIDHVCQGTVIPEPIDTKEQTADALTKALPRDQFQYL